MIRQPSTVRTVIGSGGKLFDPSQLPGLAAWYSADYGVLSQATNAASFVAGNSEYLSATNNSSLQTGSIGFNFSFWIYPTIANRSILAKGAGEVAVAYTSTNKIALQKQGASQIISPDSASLNAWNFVSVWHNQGLGYIQINNGSVHSEPLADMGVTTSDFLVGAGTGITSLFNGQIGPLGFWKRSLTSDERTFLYNNGTGRLYADLPTDFKTSLVSYWNLVETSGTRNDSHGTNHLTDNNTVGHATGPYAIPASDGQTLRRWLDRSGNGRHLEQPILLNQPTLSSGVLYSLKTMETLAATLPQPLTVFAAARSTATGSGDNYILGQWTASAVAGRWIMYYNLGNNKDIYVQRVSGADNHRVTGQQANVLQIWLGRITASTGSGSVTFTVAGISGTAQIVGSSGVGTTPSLPITMGQLTSNVPMTVYEVGLISGVSVTNEDLKKISSYLGRKWRAV